MKRSFQLLIIALLSACSFTSVDDPYRTVNIDGWNCIDTFDDFLYQMTEISTTDSRYSLHDIYPSQPWVWAADIPELISVVPIDGRYLGHRPNIEFSRWHLNQTELWIRDDLNFYIYKTGSDEVSVISRFPFDNTDNVYDDVYVKDIFEAEDGAILGINAPWDYQTKWRKPIPLFSVYKETDNKFEFYDIGLNITAEQGRNGHLGMVSRDGVIVRQGNGLIWIFLQPDNLYSYDPVSGGLRQYSISFEGIVQRMLISPEGRIIFGQEIGETDWRLTPGELIEYDPLTQTVREISVPLFRWPDYGTMLYTDSGDLWFGIHGYLSEDGVWKLKNPNRYTFTHIGNESRTYNWIQPDLLFQSTNGYLWFTALENGDFLGVPGSAWYDPETGTGCWFTTEDGNILEDSQNTLWMVIDYQIYKYELLR